MAKFKVYAIETVLHNVVYEIEAASKDDALDRLFYEDWDDEAITLRSDDTDGIVNRTIEGIVKI